MSNHPHGCPCVNCNPTACGDCGMASLGGTHLNGHGTCQHRRACEGRQMLNAGDSTKAAAMHAQGRGGVSPELGPTAEEDYAAFDRGEWPFDDDPPDPL